MAEPGDIPPPCLSPPSSMRLLGTAPSMQSTSDRKTVGQRRTCAVSCDCRGSLLVSLARALRMSRCPVQ